MGIPTKDDNGIDTYDHSNYTAPVHAIIGMAGFSLDKFNKNNVCNYFSFKICCLSQLLEHFNIFIIHWQATWSLSRVAKFGYLRGHATKQEIQLEVHAS